MALIEEFLRVLVDTDCKIAKTMFNTWIARKSTTDRDNWRIFLETPITNSWLAEFRNKTHNGLHKGLEAHRRSGNCDDEADGKLVREIHMFMTEFDSKAKPFFVATPKPPPPPKPKPTAVSVPKECFPKTELQKKKPKVQLKPLYEFAEPTPPPATKHALVLIKTNDYPGAICTALRQEGCHIPPHTYRVSLDSFKPEEFVDDMLRLMGKVKAVRVVLASNIAWALAKEVWGSLNASPRFVSKALKLRESSWWAWEIKQDE